MINQNRLRRVSMMLFFLTLFMLVVHLESLIRFNGSEKHVVGRSNESPDSVLMEIDARADSTSTWLKREFVMEDGRVVDLIGQTIDGTLRNQSGDVIQDWELKINITGDCYINQAWNGEVEIHQFVGTDREKVQRMNLQNYQLEDVTFEHRYDGDLLIPLQQGDYLIYYPSTRFSEMPIDGGEDVRIGVIFYYLDQLDLSDYVLDFHFHRSFTQGNTFYPLVALTVLWMLCMTLSGASTLAYRRAMKEMELRKSGVLCMSDIYDLIYVIHLPTGEMTPVSVDERIERERPKNRTAKELLTDFVLQDAEETYRDRMLEFVDTDTLAERLEERNSIVGEFVSTQYGWCSIRFFAMNRTEGKALENVVIAVQNINEEKKEQEAIIHQIEEAESIYKARATFADNITVDLQRPLQGLVELNETILRRNRDDSIKGYARSAHSAAYRLLMLTNGLVDSFNVESGKTPSTSEAYSLRQLLVDTLRCVLPLAEEKKVDLSLDASEALPDRLQGDPRMLREILVNLISDYLSQGNGEKLQLAVYGKALDERVHLLFSVRMLSIHTKVPEVSGLGVEIVSNLLTGMGSALRTVRSPAGRSEVYFEIEQATLDSAPVGSLTVADAEG